MRKLTKTHWEFRNNEWVPVEVRVPLQPSDPGVWVTDYRGEVGRVYHASGPLDRVYVETPKFQNGNWVWPTRGGFYKCAIRKVEFVA